MKLIFLICLFIFKHGDVQKISAHPGTQYGTVVKIIDGDTFDLLTGENKTIRVRMHGIDCPERRQAFYKVCKDALASYIFKEKVQLKTTGHDRNKRTIAIVYCNGKNMNLAMITNGYAWHYKKYSADTSFAKAERQARIGKKGLWKMNNPLPPWKFRRR